MTAPEPLDPAAIRARYDDVDLGTGMERVVRLEYLGEQARTDVPALLALVAEQATTIAATDAERDRLEAEARRVATARRLEEAAHRQTLAERDDARAEIERLRADHVPAGDVYWLQTYEGDGEWAASIGWSQPDSTIRYMRQLRSDQPGLPAMRVMRIRSWTEHAVVVSESPEDVTGTRDASRAPESPADAPDPSQGPDRAPERS